MHQSRINFVPNYHLLIVKLIIKWPGDTLFMIADMENFLAGELFIFCVPQANPGCVRHVWLIPACAA